MIERLQIRNFKSLRDVDLKLGRVNLFVGLNASGKSNVFDALRVLQGLAHGLAVSEVFAGKSRGSADEGWTGVRGGAANAARREGGAPELGSFGSVSIRADWSKPATHPEGLSASETYSVRLKPRLGLIDQERIDLTPDLWFQRAAVHDVEDPATPPAETRWRVSDTHSVGAPELSNDRAVFGNVIDLVPRPMIVAVREVQRFLADTQVLNPDIATLRGYSSDSRAARLGPSGENFPAVVQSLLSDPSTHEAFVSWVRELAGPTVVDLEVLAGASNDLMFAVREASGLFPATVVSDGTLRFAALVAAFFQPSMPARLLLEDVETGLHPNRLRLLYLLLRDRSEQTGTQVFATTHSPTLLTWLRTDEEFDHAFLCRRDAETGETRVLPLSSLPGFVELAREGQAGDLMVEGWLEDCR